MTKSSGRKPFDEVPPGEVRMPQNKLTGSDAGIAFQIPNTKSGLIATSNRYTDAAFDIT